ncbi:1803_t:CDS:1, partial [Paraglomus brasilianum]
QKQEQAKIEAHYQKESKKISQEAHLPPETLQQIWSEDHSLFSTLNPLANIHVSQRAEQFSEVVHEQLAEQEIIRQKELEIQQQAETLQKSAKIEEKLKEAQTNLGTSAMS